MTDQELISYLNRTFGRARRRLREALAGVPERIELCEDIADEIRENTGRSMLAAEGLPEETLDWAGGGKCDMYYMGDASFYCEIVLNKGVEHRNEADSDRRLIKRCGGTARECLVWISLLQPLYIMDVCSMTIRSKPREWEFEPCVPKLKGEQEVVRKVRSILQKHGFKRVSRKLAGMSVPLAITDGCKRGDATVFDCLFSDIRQLVEGRVLVSDDSSRRPIKGAYRGTEISWREWYDGRGKLKEAETFRNFASGDMVKTSLDGRGRVVKVEVYPKAKKGEYVNFTLDVKKKMEQWRKRLTHRKSGER